MSEIAEQLDAQQAMLVEHLRRADGDAVTFEELRGVGIENPALICYELAAVGLPITHTSASAEGMPPLSVRLELEPDDPAGADPPPVAPRASMRRPRIGPPRRRPVTVVAALVTVVAVAVAITFGELDHRRASSAGRGRAAAQQLPRASHHTAPAQATIKVRQPQPSPPASGVTAPSQPQLSPAIAVSLEAEGHQLLAEGSYPSAAAKLASAVRASRQSLARCREPASDACLTFAYALYDLGRALRLEGHRAEAVAVLNDRLSIDNQRETVQRELDLARGARA
jgi:hypothetical protein